MMKLVVLFQLISLKTAPVATADQFAIVPADLDGMGGVAIAVRDALADPFVNPAKGARLSATLLLAAPSLYAVTQHAGAGRTLPLGLLTSGGAWFGGAMIGVQQVDPAQPANVFGPVPLNAAPTLPGNFGPPPAAQSHGNSYAGFTIGRRLAGGWSAGVAARWAGLAAVDGTDQLYAGAAGLAQHGNDYDLRAGVLREDAAGTLEAVLVAHRYDMTHDVTWVTSVWDPGTRQFAPASRIDHNRDVTNTLGAMLAGTRPAPNGWTLGASATVNRLTHPEIPDYVLQSVPRDPGASWAADLGIGAARAAGPTRVAVDLVVEPAWSHTWAAATDTMTTASGGALLPGAHTVDNRFAFTNAMIRMGMSRDVGPAQFQLGLAVSSIGYTLRQTDHVGLTGRSDGESWVEWTPTWGLSLRFPDLEIRYRGRSANGTGRPVVQTFCCAPGIAVPQAGSGGPSILVTPAGPLSLTNVSVVTHQVSIAVPFK